MMRFVASFACVFLLPACTSDETFREQSKSGTRSGEPVYRFKSEVKVHRDMATARETHINVQATRLCPAGYKELARSEPALRTNRYSYPIGNIMVHKADRLSAVTVEIACKE